MQYVPTWISIHINSNQHANICVHSFADVATGVYGNNLGGLLFLTMQALGLEAVGISRAGSPHRLLRDEAPNAIEILTFEPQPGKQCGKSKWYETLRKTLGKILTLNYWFAHWNSCVSCHSWMPPYLACQSTSTHANLIILQDSYRHLLPCCLAGFVVAG